MLINKEGDRRPPSKVQDMPSTTKLTKKTRHVPTAEQETNTEHKAKSKTQNTKQNHMPIRKEGGRRPPSKIQDMHTTSKLPKNTRLAPVDK